MKHKLGYNWTGKEYFNRYMSIVFPSDQIRVLDFNRLFKTLNGQSPQDIIKGLKKNFKIKKLQTSKIEDVKPKKRYNYSIYIGKQWYSMALKRDLYPQP